MSASLKSLLLALDSKGITSRNALRWKEMERRKRIGVVSGRTTTRPMIWTKRRALVGVGFRKPVSRVERRVRELQRLVPNGESMKLGVLFRETMDYMEHLQMQVKSMKIMVKVLSEDSDE